MAEELTLGADNDLVSQVLQNISAVFVQPVNIIFPEGLLKTR